MMIANYALIYLIYLVLVLAHVEPGSCPLSSRDISGGSPIKHCLDLPDGHDQTIIQRLVVEPNVLQPGGKVSACASMFVNQDITCGATVDVMLLYDKARIYQGTLDLCMLASKTTLPCPIKAGQRFLLAQADLPCMIPAGLYTLTMRFFTATEHPIACVTGQFRYVYHAGETKPTK